MTQSFEDFVNRILLSETVESEREIIADEQANMRTIIKSDDLSQSPRTVAKLIYLAMYGENVNWGQVEVVKLMNADRFSYKRIGYLAATSLLNDNTELVVLITATVQKDLQSANLEVQKLALNLIANIGTPELSQSLPQQVLQLIDSPNPVVQKRAAMAAVTMLRQNKDIAETFRPCVARLLNGSSHCCVLAGVHLALRLLEIAPELRTSWSQFSNACATCLKYLFELKQTNEYTFMIFNDPFLQIMFLRLIGQLGSPTDELDEILSSVATGADVRRNAGRSILLECVSAIARVARAPGLRSLAINQVGRLFSFGNQPTVLYSALSAFSRILYAGNSVLDRSSADSQVLQRYKSEVVKCLDHRDPSIRRRALDVVAALVDEKNVEVLIPEVINYVRLADRTFRGELVAKVFQSVQRFGRTQLWKFDTVLRLLVDSGNYAGSDVVINFSNLIAVSASIRTHAIRALSDALKTNTDNQPLLQVAAWALGEFQEDPSDTIDVAIRLTLLPQTSVETRLVLVTALAKLASRFSQREKVAAHLATFANSNSLELQQRVGELVRVLAHEDVCEALLAPIEVVAEEEPQASAAPAQTPAASPSESSLIELLGEPAASPKKAAVAAVAAVAAPVATPPAFKPPANAREALRTSDYVVYFELQRNPANPAQLAIRSTTVNLTAVALTNFVVKYKLPQGWSLTMQAPSSNVLEAAGGGVIQQIFFLTNRGTLPLGMAAQISYMYRTQPITEESVINPIFG
jgi:hypothetical protein